MGHPLVLGGEKSKKLMHTIFVSSQKTALATLSSVAKGKQGEGLGDRYKHCGAPEARHSIHQKVPHFRCSDVGESRSQPCRAGLTFGRPALRALFNGSAVLVINPGKDLLSAMDGGYFVQSPQRLSPEKEAQRSGYACGKLKREMTRQRTRRV
jgi:hypothetical protein